MTLQDALDVIRNNQFANGPRYEQAWKVLEAAVLATAQNKPSNTPCAYCATCVEVLHHLDLFTKTTGGDPYVSVAATLLRNRISGSSPAEPPCPGEQCANYPDGCSQCRHLERESLAEPR